MSDNLVCFQDRTEALIEHVPSDMDMDLDDRISQLSSVLEHLPMGILIHSQKNVIYANSAACRLLGVDRGLLRGRHFLEFVENSTQYTNCRDAFNRVLSDGKELVLPEIVVSSHDDRQNITALSVHRLPWDGTPLAQISLQDITAQKTNEQALSLAKQNAERANRVKSEFLAHMSHELRTPLNAIIGFSQIWMDEVFGPVRNTKYLEYAKDINHASTHLLEIIVDILDLAKIEAGGIRLNLEDFSLDDAITSCVSMLQRSLETGGVSVNFSITPKTLSLRADRRLIKQVLINIVGNALKFTPTGGQVDINVKQAGPASIAIEISDTGIGIPNEALVTVLEPFGQVHQGSYVSHEGTGLGLPLAKQMVELHGGDLKIESTHGAGTVVTIYLPHGN